MKRGDEARCLSPLSTSPVGPLYSALNGKFFRASDEHGRAMLDPCALLDGSAGVV
jgi:hypothetical protein